MPNVRGKAQYLGGWPVDYDPITGEITMSSAPVWFYDDFGGAGHLAIPTSVSAGSNWCAKLVKTSGSPSVGAIVNLGAVKIALDATNEIQDAVLYTADQLAYQGTQGLGFETRLQMTTTPTAGTKATAGMQSASSGSGPTGIAAYLRFSLTGNGQLLAESYDGVTQLSVNTGITIATNTEWHILRVDASDVTNVKFYVDGNQVCTTTTFPFAATGALAQLQPMAEVYKTAGTSVGALTLDYIQVTQNTRQ